MVIEGSYLEKKKVSVIQSFPIWLGQTETWMYNQARYLTDDVECHIVCERTENLDQFFLPNIHSLDQGPKWRNYLDRGLRLIRARRHLGFLVKQARQHRAQVLHSHFGNVGWTNLGAAIRRGLSMW